MKRADNEVIRKRIDAAIEKEMEKVYDFLYEGGEYDLSPGKFSWGDGDKEMKRKASGISWMGEVAKK